VHIVQYWSYSKTGEIRRDEMCVDYAGGDVMIYPCHGSLGNQQWTYDEEVKTVFLKIISMGTVLINRIIFQEKWLLHGPSRKCLGMTSSKDKLTMETCERHNDNQKWKLENYDREKLNKKK